MLEEGGVSLVGCKRILQSNNGYLASAQDNVTTDGVVHEMDDRPIVPVDGTRAEFDVFLDVQPAAAGDEA